MCNEFRFTQSLDRLRERFLSAGLPLGWAGGAPNLEPRESIRPTDAAPTVAAGPELVTSLRWGFVGPRGAPVINYRSDGRRFQAGRCLVPMDGFYEYTGARSPKSKWLFTVAGIDMFCVAGLVRNDRFTLLTMPAGPDMRPYHDRQIVILPRAAWSAWLGPGPSPAIQQLPAGTLRAENVR